MFMYIICILVIPISNYVLFIDVIIIVVCPNVYVYNMYSCNTYK